ncbi:hypothetical protein DPMN_073549 [Dreissena polymorpha]|uniref:Uncharacterized protein n=1 Tax=Dreissena polymorpha TaxID=45954 RepID=A0A9D4BZ81_DREPO|nr:hypothetical protein DPMN_073549 [Dreissena polymorpha]
MPPQKLDGLRKVISEQMQDNWQPRTGVAIILDHLAPILPKSELPLLFNFFLSKGLGDRSQEVCSLMRQAAMTTINVHGKVWHEGLHIQLKQARKKPQMR